MERNRNCSPRMGKFIADKRILRLIGLTLRSGIMENGITQMSQKGSVQGSPLSPLLSNIVLDELDKEMEKQGYEFCRYADDLVTVKHQGSPSSKKQQFPFKISFRSLRLLRDSFKNVCRLLVNSD